jgi:hypothetical protein
MDTAWLGRSTKNREIFRRRFSFVIEKGPTTDDGRPRRDHHGCGRRSTVIGRSAMTNEKSPAPHILKTSLTCALSLLLPRLRDYKPANECASNQNREKENLAGSGLA